MRETARLQHRRALVTGAGGFVGVHLCRALAVAGAEVHGTLRPGGSRWRRPALQTVAHLHEVDLRHYEALRSIVRRLRPDYIFHAAASPAYLPRDLREVVADTVQSLANLLDASQEVSYRRLIHLGSSLEYGPAAEAHSEDDPLHPGSLRGVTKALSSLLALEHARRTGRPVTVLRLFSVYGPWEPMHRLIPRAIRAALLDEELRLTPAGLRRDLVFAGDVADASIRAACRPGVEGEVLNVGSGCEVANEEVVALVQEVAGSRIRVRAGAYRPRPTDTTHWRADPLKAHHLLRWKPRHSLRDGLARTVPWVREQLRQEGA